MGKRNLRKPKAVVYYVLRASCLIRPRNAASAASAAVPSRSSPNSRDSRDEVVRGLGQGLEGQAALGLGNSLQEPFSLGRGFHPGPAARLRCAGQAQFGQHLLDTREELAPKVVHPAFQRRGLKTSGFRQETDAAPLAFAQREAPGGHVRNSAPRDGCLTRRPLTVSARSRTGVSGLSRTSASELASRAETVG